LSRHRLSSRWISCLIPSHRPARRRRLPGISSSLVKKDPHHRQGSFFRSRRGSFPRHASIPVLTLDFGPWTFLVSRPNLSRPDLRLGVGSRISWVTFLSKIRDPTQPLVFPPSHFGYDQAAGDLFSPIEKRIPTPAGTKFSSPAGSLSPARGSRRTFIAGRAPTRVRRKSPISIQPENSNSFKIGFLRAEHFLGSPARGGTPIATRREPVESWHSDVRKAPTGRQTP